MGAPSNLRPGDVPVQICPNCDSTDIVCATLTDRYIYLRCEACGEVWSIPERRQKDRPRGGRFVDKKPPTPSD
jgi:hypothetical protein